MLVHAVDAFRQGTSRSEPWTAEAVTTYPEFVALGSAWNALVDRAGFDHPFLRHEWLTTWWECFGAGRQLHVIIIKCGDELVGAAPLMVSQGRMYGMRLRQLWDPLESTCRHASLSIL